MKSPSKSPTAEQKVETPALVKPWLNKVVARKLTEAETYFLTMATELPFNSIVRGRFPVPREDLLARARAAVAAGGSEARLEVLGGLCDRIQTLTGIEKNLNHFAALIRRGRLALSQQLEELLLHAP